MFDDVIYAWLYRLTFSGREPEDYFDRFVWPAYVKCYTELLCHGDVGRSIIILELISSRNWTYFDSNDRTY